MGKAIRYKDLEGEYDFGNYMLFIDHIQGDLFASPSRIRIIVNQNISEFPKEHYGKNTSP